MARTQVFHRGNGIARFLTVLEERGIDLWSSLAELGIDRRRLFEPDYYLSLDQEFEVFSLGKRASGCPHLGLECGWSYNFASFGALGLALVTAPTLGDACDFAIDNPDLTYAFLRFHFRIEGDRVCLATEKPVDLGRHEIFLVERDLTAAVRLLSDTLGKPLPLVHACFAYPPPDYSERYRKIFRCPLTFKGGANYLEFPAACLDLKLPHRDRYAHNIARQQAAFLQRHTQPHPNTVQRVMGLFLSDPPRFSRLEVVADALHMSPRTLRRKLEQEGTSFSRLTHALRHQLAADWLQEGRILHDIAAQLGYSDAVNFSHAFKRWTGLTPGEYRKTLQR